MAHCSEGAPDEEGKRPTVVRFKRVMCGSGARQNAGYTLMEVIVALAVISAASFIVIGGFTRSKLLADRSVSTSIAAAFAEERLAALQQNPSAFVWPDDAKLADAAFSKIVPKDTDPAVPQQGIPVPATLPSNANQKVREQILYAEFSSEIFVRLPKPDSLVYEVSVAVTWLEGGRKQVITLTTAVPKNFEKGSA